MSRGGAILGLPFFILWSQTNGKFHCGGIVPSNNPRSGAMRSKEKYLLDMDF